MDDGHGLRVWIEQGLAQKGFVNRGAIRFKALRAAGHRPPGRTGSRLSYANKRNRSCKRNRQEKPGSKAQYLPKECHETGHKEGRCGLREARQHRSPCTKGNTASQAKEGLTGAFT